MSVVCRSNVDGQQRLLRVRALQHAYALAFSHLLSTRNFSGVVSEDPLDPFSPSAAMRTITNSRHTWTRESPYADWLNLCSEEVAYLAKIRDCNDVYIVSAFLGTFNAEENGSPPAVQLPHVVAYFEGLATQDEWPLAHRLDSLPTMYIAEPSNPPASTRKKFVEWASRFGCSEADAHYFLQYGILDSKVRKTVLERSTCRVKSEKILNVVLPALGFLSNMPADVQVLDIGGQYGRNSTVLSQNVSRGKFSWYEPNSPLYFYLGNKFSQYIDSFHNCKNRFGLITIRHVLHHVPMSLWYRFAQIMSVGGVMLVTDHHESSDVEFVLLQHRFYACAKGEEVCTHGVLSEREIIVALADSGLICATFLNSPFQDSAIRESFQSTTDLVFVKTDQVKFLRLIDTLFQSCLLNSLFSVPRISVSDFCRRTGMSRDLIHAMASSDQIVLSKTDTGEFIVLKVTHSILNVLGMEWYAGRVQKATSVTSFQVEKDLNYLRSVPSLDKLVTFTLHDVQELMAIKKEATNLLYRWLALGFIQVVPTTDSVRRYEWTISGRMHIHSKD